MTVEDFRIERECPRCKYPVRPGWLHRAVPQPEGSNVTVCALERSPAGCAVRGPMVEVISYYLDHPDVAS